MEGDGQVSMPGNRISRPLVVEVTDETGTRVENAIVSFRVPEDGITGTFHNGLKTDILRTDGDGRAQMHGLWMGGLAGQFQVHMTVAKGEARAGAISTQFIAPDNRRSSGLRDAILRPHGRLLQVGALVLAVAAAGYAKQSLFANRGQTVTAPPVIGTPTVTVGRP